MLVGKERFILEADDQARKWTPAVENQLPLAVQRTGVFKGSSGLSRMTQSGQTVILKSMMRWTFWSFWLAQLIPVPKCVPTSLRIVPLRTVLEAVPGRAAYVMASVW